MKVIIKYHLALIFALLSILMVFIWFKDSYIYTPEELYFTNYQVTINKNTTSWDYSINGGGPVLPKYHSSIIPNGLFYYLSSNLGLQNYIIQRAFMAIMIFLTLMSVGYFLKLFTNNSLIILASALMYYLNFYVKSTPFYTAKMFQLILTPLLFTWTYKYIKTLDYRYAAYNFLGIFLTQAMFVNLANTAVIFLIYPLAVIYSFVKLSSDIFLSLKKYISRIFLFFLPIISIFIYHAFVWYFYFNNNFIDVLRSSDKFVALSAPLSLVLQLRGAWWESVGFSGASYNPWFWFYNNIRIQQFSYLIVAFSITFIISKKVSKSGLYFLFFFLFSLVLSTGSSFYPDLYKWLFNNIPYFYIFREPWPKFIPLTILSLTALLAISLNRFKNRFLRILLPLIVLSLVLIKGYPFFSPDFLPYYQPRWYNPHIKIPSYWDEWIRWSKKNQDKTIFLVPTNYFKRNWYKEDLGNGNYPIAQIFGFSNTIYDAVLYNESGSVVNYFTSQNNNNYIKIMPTDYFLIQDDIEKSSGNYSQLIENSTNDILNRFTDKPILKFGDKLTLFSIKPEYRVPFIFTSNNYYVAQDLKKLSEIISKDEYKINSVVFLKKDLKNNNKKSLETIKSLNKDKPGIEFKKISNTSFEINVKKVNQSFILVFNTLFNNYWRLQQTNSKITINNEKHIQVNGYANSWIIDPQEICRPDKCIKNKDGSYDISFKLNYWPQLVFTIGSSINITILIGCVFYLSLSLFKRRS